MSYPTFKCPKCGNTSYIDAQESTPAWVYLLCVAVGSIGGTIFGNLIWG